MNIPKRSTKAERNARPPSPKAYRTRPLVTFSLSLQDKHQLVAIATARNCTRSAAIGQLIRRGYEDLTDYTASANAKIAETFKPKTRAHAVRIEGARDDRARANSPKTSAESRTLPLPLGKHTARRVGAK